MSERSCYHQQRSRGQMDMQAPGREGSPLTPIQQPFGCVNTTILRPGLPRCCCCCCCHGQFTHSLSDAAFFHVYGIVHSRYQWR